VTGVLAGTGGSAFHVSLNGGDFSTPFWSVSRSWNNIFTSPEPFELSEVFSSFTYQGGVNPSGYGSFTFSGSTLQWSAVPEPSCVFVSALLAAGFLRRRRDV
jgi:hypothetical protein